MGRIKTKTCRLCAATFPVSEFSRYGSTCFECRLVAECRKRSEALGLDRICRKCGEFKLSADFTSKGSFCRACESAKRKMRRRSDPERAREYGRRKQRERRERDPAGVRAHERAKMRARKYGMEPEAVNAHLVSINHCCEICGCHIDSETLRVDHCHKTGIVRGFLCCRCNKGIGLFEDNPRLLIEAMKYVDRIRLVA